MPWIPSPRRSGRILLAALGLLFVYHLLLLFGAISPAAAWGGRAAPAHRVPLELLVTALFALSVALQNGDLKFQGLDFTAKAGTWFFFVFLCLNTLGNATAAHPLERYGMTALTLVLAALAFRLARAKT